VSPHCDLSLITHIRNMLGGQMTTQLFCVAAGKVRLTEHRIPHFCKPVRRELGPLRAVQPGDVLPPMVACKMNCAAILRHSWRRLAIGDAGRRLQHITQFSIIFVWPCASIAWLLECPCRKFKEKFLAGASKSSVKSYESLGMCSIAVERRP